ncbi:MAG: ATP-binding protein, partial [Cyanobacteria bacterium P01_G01_bin.49]
LEIRRVLTNLISNAIKFTDQGFIAIRLTQNNASMICLEVEDTGIGISADNQSVIFDRFRQGNHKRSGHGLGLYLCYQIVEAHKGTLEMSSEVGKGSIFTICLPTDIKE